MKMLAALLAVFLPGLLAAQVYQGQTLVSVSARADTTAVVPGKPVRLAVTLKMAPGWHTYWQYSGDAGIPTTIEWKLPEGWAAGPIEWPLPKAILEPGDIQVYAYKGETTLLQTLIPPANLTGERVDFTARVAWLVCEAICIPGNTEVSVNLPVATDPAAARPANEALFAGAQARLPSAEAPPFPVRWARDGDAWVGTIDAPAGTTEVAFFPLPGEGEVGHPSLGRDGEAFTVRITAAGALNGVLAVTDPQGQRGWLVSTGEGTSPSGSGAPTGATLDSPTATPNPSAAPLSAAALLAALGAGLLGGIILNLMPCVLPVISLKIFGFVRHSGASRRTIALHGLAFAAGIFAWFLGLAAVVVAVKAAGVEATWAFQFQNVWFNVAVATIVFVFALNLFGVFELALPGRAASALTDAGAREGYDGSFFQGVFATLLATPCTGPFLGSVLGIAFTQSAPVTFALFASVAAGMALPYLLLSLQPAWVRHLPRPGAWMERLKQFMAFPLLATLLWLLYVIGNQRGTAAIIWVGAFLLLVGLALWIYGIVASPVVAGGRRVLGIVAAVALAAGGGWYFLGHQLAAEQTPVAAGGEGAGAVKDGIAWQPFSKAGLERLLAEGKPVFVDFTADWCITCKFNERTAINTPAVRARFAELGIVPVKADWTNANPEITEALRAFGRVGVPFYLLYPAGQPKDPIVLPELLTEGIVLDALAKAGR